MITIRKYMLAFSYTIDLQQREMLNTITRVRNQILSLPLPPKTEAKLAWEGTAIRTWATLSLAGYTVPKHEVATILANPTRPTHATSTISGLRRAYDYIHHQWRGNPRPVSLSALETLFHICCQTSDIFPQIEPFLKELLSYIDAQEEHPVLAAGLAHIHIITIADLPESGLFARLVHYLFLAKYGFDIRGWATPERVWQADMAPYTRLIASYTRDHALTGFLDYIVQSMATSLETLSADIRDTRFHIEYPASFWEISDRQKEIMKLLEVPAATITNRQVHKRFKVSQITASRDLARLTALGLLYPHGKGRSVYYTKI